jgi:N-acetylglutamate synthase-like GNAT family acetyltransferase
MTIHHPLIGKDGNLPWLTMTWRFEHLADRLDAIPELAQAHHAAWASLSPSLSVADSERRFAERAHRGQVPTALIATVDNAVVGVACLVECDLDSHAHLTPWLASVLVLPEYRGKGIGSALSERLAAEAAFLGFPSLFLFTFDKQSMYTRLGWTTIDRGEHARRPVCVMARRL